jgi:hypothetical protein
MRRVKTADCRSKFCQLAMTDKKRAAEKLRVMAIGLENCRNTSDIIYSLTQIFGVSERTVFNDLKK